MLWVRAGLTDPGDAAVRPACRFAFSAVAIVARLICPGPCVGTADSGGLLMARQADLLAYRWARAR